MIMNTLYVPLKNKNNKYFKEVGERNKRNEY